MGRPIALILIVFVCVSLYTPITAVDDGWARCGQSFYEVNPDQTGRVSHEQAVETCKKRTAHLVVPSSQVENDFVLDLFLRRSSDSETKGFWLGCSKNSRAGNWSCDESGGSGIDTQYRNWSPSHLDGINSPEKHCIAAGSSTIFTDAPGQWKAQKCSNSRSVVCEKLLALPTLSEACAMVAGDGHSCLAAKLLSTVQSKHLSRVLMHAGQSRYSISSNVDPGNETLVGYSVLSTDAKIDGIKTVSWNIDIHYYEEHCDGVTGSP